MEKRAILVVNNVFRNLPNDRGYILSCHLLEGILSIHDFIYFGSVKIAVIEEIEVDKRDGKYTVRLSIMFNENSTVKANRIINEQIHTMAKKVLSKKTRK